MVELNRCSGVDILVGFHPPQRWVSCRKI